MKDWPLGCRRLGGAMLGFIAIFEAGRNADRLKDANARAGRTGLGDLPDAETLAALLSNLPRGEVQLGKLWSVVKRHWKRREEAGKPVPLDDMLTHFFLPNLPTPPKSSQK